MECNAWQVGGVARFERRAMKQWRLTPLFF